jgi:hypothetical protein
MPILTFFSSIAGRWVRAVVGLALIGVAAALGGTWWLLAVLGAVFVLVGALDVCLLAPLAGRPLKGSRFRAAVGR